MLAAVVGLFIITWTAGLRRHYHRTLESEDTRPRTGSNRRSNRLVRSTEERAIFQFSDEIVLSEDGARAFPFLIEFFVISGPVFQFPAELASNWLFRITECDGRKSRAASLVSGYC
jgi:hypothetical protein